MKQLGEGPLVVFGIEMFRLIAVKDKQNLQEVLGHVETIYNTGLRMGRLVGVNEAFLTIFGNLAKMTSKDEIDTLRTYSSMIFHTLLQRKEVLSPEVNSIIDQAGLSYNDAEGNRLLCSLTPFQDYPNTNKSSYSVCEGLIDSLLQPIRRPTDSMSRQALISSINEALRENFPQILRVRGAETPTTLSLIGTTISRIGTRLRKRKKKHHRHKKKRKRKRHRKPEYDNKDTKPISQELDYQHPGEIEALTTKRYRTMKRRPRNAILWTTYPPLSHYPTPITTTYTPITTTCPTTHIPTKIIVPRKLVHPRIAKKFRQKKQAGHARVASLSTRTLKNQESLKFEDMDSIDMGMIQVLLKQLIN